MSDIPGFDAAAEAAERAHFDTWRSQCGDPPVTDAEWAVIRESGPTFCQKGTLAALAAAVPVLAQAWADELQAFADRVAVDSAGRALGIEQSAQRLRSIGGEG